MNKDPSPRTLYAGGGPARPRMSREVVVPLLIAAGLVGVPLAFGLWQRAHENEEPEPAPPTVDANTEYANNHFLPGAGYYHAPYRAWFPFPFNYHDSGRGWYRGGGWRTSAEEDEEERRTQARTSGFAARGGGGPGMFVRPQSSQPTPEAVMRANAASKAHAGSVTRGGFGHSSRPSIS